MVSIKQWKLAFPSLVLFYFLPILSQSLPSLPFSTKEFILTQYWLLMVMPFSAQFPYSCLSKMCFRAKKKLLYLYYTRHIFSIGKDIQALLTCCCLLEEWHLPCECQTAKWSTGVQYRCLIWARLLQYFSCYKTYSHFEFSTQQQVWMDKVW